MVRRAAAVLALVALAAGAGSASGSPNGKGAANARLFVKVRIPRPGDVVLARIVIRARPGIGVPVRLRLRAMNAERLPPAIAAVGGVVSLHRRPFKYVSIVAIVNRLPPGPKPAGADARPRRYDPFIAVELINAKGARLAEARQYFRAHVRVAYDVLTRFGQPGQQPLVDLFQPVDADSATPIQRAIAERGLDAIPLAGLPARKSSALTRAAEAEPRVILGDVADTAKSACAKDKEHTEEGSKRIEGDLATSLVPITTDTSSTQRCDLSRYSFKGLKLSYSVPNAAGALTSYSLSSVTGNVCGDLLKAPWNVTFASTGLGKRSVHPNFAAANPATIENRSFAGGNSIAVKLALSTESSPLMKISAVTKGKVSKVVAQPGQAAVASAAVQTC